MNQLAKQSAAPFTLTFLNGPLKGSVYQLLAGEITLGRSNSNDIVIQGDQKVSRNHATIRISSKGVEIFDVSQRNVINVDGKESSRQSLKNNSLIKIGRTKMRFNRQQDAMATDGAAPPHLSSVGPTTAPPKMRPNAPAGKKNNTGFYVILAVIAGLLYLIFSDSSKKQEDVEIRTNESAITEINDAERRNIERFNTRAQKGFDSPQYKDAQANYIKGRRDFQKGQFGRALVSFQACLGLFPRHELCAIYKRMATKKKGEMIQYYMVLGRKYKEQNQFAACASAFKNVMNMERDRTKLAYKEAKANSIYCQKELEDDF